MSMHYLSRRRVLAAAAGGTALVLVGCGSAGLPFVPGQPQVDDGNPPTGPAPAPSVSAQSDTVLVADVDGSLFEIDPAGNRVARLGPGGLPLWEADAADLNGPRAVAVDSHGTICVANHGDSSILVFDPLGVPLGELGGPGDEAGRFNFVPDVAFDAEDRLYAVDALNHRIQVLDGTGAPVLVFGAPGSGPGELNAPRAVAFDTQGRAHVLDAGNCRIQVFDREGRALYEYGTHGRGEGEFLLPHDLAIDAWDRVYVADPATRRVLIFEDAGHRTAPALELVDEEGAPVSPLRVALHPDGGLLVSVLPAALGTPPEPAAV